MKPGIKTSEFLLTIATLGASSYLALQGVDTTVVLAMLGSTGAYALSRGLAKHGNGHQ